MTVIRKSNSRSPAQVVAPEALAQGVAGASFVPTLCQRAKSFFKKLSFSH